MYVKSKVRSILDRGKTKLLAAQTVYTSLFCVFFSSNFEHGKRIERELDASGEASGVRVWEGEGGEGLRSPPPSPSPLCLVLAVLQVVRDHIFNHNWTKITYFLYAQYRKFWNGNSDCLTCLARKPPATQATDCLNQTKFGCFFYSGCRFFRLIQYVWVFYDLLCLTFLPNPAKNCRKGSL